MARIIAVANQKGGVGKTTTAVNLAAALARAPQRVLLVDLDAQGNATMGSGVDKREVEASTCDVLLGEVDGKAAVVTTAEGFDLMPGNIDLTAAEIQLMDAEGREQRLKSALQPLRSDYDFIIIDCPPAGRWPRSSHWPYPAWSASVTWWSSVATDPCAAPVCTM